MATADEGNPVEHILREEPVCNECPDRNHTSNIEEPSTKKARTSASPRERNKYKGMRIRQCLCAQPECLPRLKGWIDLGDSKRQGFKELPRQSSKTTPVGLEKNRIRDIMFQHIRGTKAPRYEENDKTNRERKLFVAYHHFHPLMLQEGNLGPMPHVYFELAERIGGFHESDTVQSHQGICFHPIPNYPKELQIKDFENAGGVEQSRYARNRSKPKATDDQTFKGRKGQNMKTRVREVLGQMERDPLRVANEYIEMKDRLDSTELLQNSGGQIRGAIAEGDERLGIPAVEL